MENINKKLKRGKLLILLIAIALIATYATIPSSGKAVTVSGMEDTISDSDPNATAQSVTHTIVATTTVPMVAQDDILELVFDTSFSNISSGNFTCPGVGVEGGSGNTLTCTYTSGLATGSLTFILTNTTNPSTEGSYTVNLTSKSSTSVEYENGSARIAIIDDIEVSASVEASLTFTVNGVATSSEINGVTTTGSSTDKILAFGTVISGSAYTLGQQLNVSTNAGQGFTVTVQQDGNLQTAGGADIDSFDDGVAASSTPLVWTAPAGLLSLGEESYGHFGITSLDASLSDGDPFGSSLYKGFYGSGSGSAIEVMYNNGPADGSTIEIGSSTVAYTLQISDLQETGDYTSNLTYICTPKY